MLDTLVERYTATPAELMLAGTLLMALGGLLIGASVFAGPAVAKVAARSVVQCKAAWHVRTSRRKRELDRKSRFACK